VDIPEPGIRLQIAEDMARVLVEEQGHPDNLGTLGLAVLIQCFARLRVQTKASISRVEHNSSEEVWRRAQIHPKPLSFWINTLVGSVGRERNAADMRYIYGRRVEGDFRFTALDS